MCSHLVFRVLWWSPLRKRDVVKHHGNKSWQLQLHEILLGHPLNLGGNVELWQLCGSLQQRLVFVRRAAAAVACVCDNDNIIVSGCLLHLLSIVVYCT